MFNIHKIRERNIKKDYKIKCKKAIKNTLYDYKDGYGSVTINLKYAKEVTNVLVKKDICFKTEEKDNRLTIIFLKRKKGDK